MPNKKGEKQGLSRNLEKLSQIAEWFEAQEDIDIEEGLKKVKEASALIKESKERLKEIENEFEEVKKEIDSDFGQDYEDTDEEDSAED